MEKLWHPLSNAIQVKTSNMTENKNMMIKCRLLNIRCLSSKVRFVNNLTINHHFDFLCLTETWLHQEDYIIHTFDHIPAGAGWGGGVAAIYNSGL